jgi:hypothetical protein
VHSLLASRVQLIDYSGDARAATQSNTVEIPGGVPNQAAVRERAALPVDPQTANQIVSTAANAAAEAATAPQRPEVTGMHRYGGTAAPSPVVGPQLPLGPGPSPESQLLPEPGAEEWSWRQLLAPQTGAEGRGPGRLTAAQQVHPEEWGLIAAARQGRRGL